MQRKVFIERIRRQIYNGQPPADATITVNLVNLYINDALAAAAKANWIENLKIENCGFTNNSFYTTFSSLAISGDAEFGIYNVTLPQIPTGLGRNEGVGAAYVVDEKGLVSKPLIFLNANQVNYVDDLPDMNGTMCWNEGVTLKIKSPNTTLVGYTAKVRMVSGGNTSLDSEMNVPQEMIPMMNDYILKQLMIEKSNPSDVINDGTENQEARK